MVVSSNLIIYPKIGKKITIFKIALKNCFISNQQKKNNLKFKNLIIWEIRDEEIFINTTPFQNVITHLYDLAYPFTAFFVKSFEIKNVFFLKILGFYFNIYIQYFYIRNNANGDIQLKSKDFLWFVIDNRKLQLYTRFHHFSGLFKMFSTGFFLKFFNIFKKELKKKLTSTIIHFRAFLNILVRHYSNYFLIAFIKGTKKKFFFWFNLCKYKIKNFNLLFYFYIPAISISTKKFKKIKSIKKRLKKKYLYSENLI